MPNTSLIDPINSVFNGVLTGPPLTFLSAAAQTVEAAGTVTTGNYPRVQVSAASAITLSTTTPLGAPTGPGQILDLESVGSFEISIPTGYGTTVYSHSMDTLVLYPDQRILFWSFVIDTSTGPTLVWYPAFATQPRYINVLAQLRKVAQGALHNFLTTATLGRMTYAGTGATAATIARLNAAGTLEVDITAAAQSGATFSFPIVLPDTFARGSQLGIDYTVATTDTSAAGAGPLIQVALLNGATPAAATEQLSAGYLHDGANAIARLTTTATGQAATNTDSGAIAWQNIAAFRVLAQASSAMARMQDNIGGTPTIRAAYGSTTNEVWMPWATTRTLFINIESDNSRRCHALFSAIKVSLC